MISLVNKTTVFTYVIYLLTLFSPDSTVDDSGVGQRQLNGTASKAILKLSEYHEIHSLGL